MPRVGALLIVGLGVGAAASAAASEPTAASEPAPSGRHQVLGIGILGVLGGNFLDAPTDQNVEVNGLRGHPMGVGDDSGFAGFTGGGGLTVQARIYDYAGIELDLLRTRDSGKAKISVSQAGVSKDFTLELSQSAFHLPLLIRGILPGPLVEPSVFVGPEFVVVDGASAEIVDGQSPYAVDIVALPRSYTMVTFGAGMDIHLPVEPFDVCLPLSLRGSVTPGIGDGRQDRGRYIGTDPNHLTRIEHETRWKYQLGFTLGAMVWF